MSSLFFFNDTATTEIYTLSLHDALPISRSPPNTGMPPAPWSTPPSNPAATPTTAPCSSSSAMTRSEEHTSELQSPCNLVCRLLLEKKKKNIKYYNCNHCLWFDDRSSYLT